MRFLVTGGTGFVGYPLVTELARRHGASSIQILARGDSRNAREQRRFDSLRQAGFDILTCDLLKDTIGPESVKPFDVLLHLAACGGTEKDTPLMRVNDEGTARLLDALLPVLAGKRVIFAGTMASVDRAFCDNTPQNEDYPCSPRTAYGRTKLRAEELIRSRGADGFFRWTILRLPTIYGPNFRTGGMFQVIADGLRAQSLSVRLNWPGRLSLLHVDDLVQMIIATIESPAASEQVFHLGSVEPAFDQVIELCAQALGIERRRITLPAAVWSVIRFFLWRLCPQWPAPFSLRNLCWRASLVVIDGIVSDHRKFDLIMKPPPRDLTSSFREMYRLTPDAVPGFNKQ